MTIQQWQGWRDTSDKAITLTGDNVQSALALTALTAIRHVTKHRVITSPESGGNQSPLADQK